MESSYGNVQQRNILTVLKDSLRDRPLQKGQDLAENEVRYKLMIDPSEDDSLVRHLFFMGVLDRENTRMYVCSDFPGDSHIQKVIAKHAMYMYRVTYTVSCTYMYATHIDT